MFETDANGLCSYATHIYQAGVAAVIVPVGATEQHGPNGLIGTDHITAEVMNPCTKNVCFHKSTIVRCFYTIKQDGNEGRVGNHLFLSAMGAVYRRAITLSIFVYFSKERLSWAHRSTSRPQLCDNASLLEGGEGRKNFDTGLEGYGSDRDRSMEVVRHRTIASNADECIPSHLCLPL